MKKSLLIFAAALLASCAGGNASSAPSASDSAQEVTVTDGIGRTVTMNPTDIKKVVCVGAGALRVYSYVGDMNLLSGVEDIDHPDRTTMWQDVARPYYMANKDLLKTLPSCGRGGPQFQSPETEAILNCAPDLIVSEYEDVKVASDMEDATGAKVFTVKIGSKTCFDPIFASTLDSLATLLGRKEKATTIVNFINESKADIVNRTKDIAEEDRLNVYLAGLGNWGRTGLYDSSPSIPMFEIANINNMAKAKTIEAAEFVALGPTMDKMIIDAAGLAKIKTAYQEDHDIFVGNKAVENGEVYLQMAYNAYYTNLEIALMDAYYDAIAVYPDRFAGFDLDAKCAEITRVFNGKDIYADIKAMPSSFGGFQKIQDLKAFLEK